MPCFMVHLGGASVCHLQLLDVLYRTCQEGGLVPLLGPRQQLAEGCKAAAVTYMSEPAPVVTC